MIDIILKGEEVGMQFGRQRLFSNLTFSLTGGVCVGISGNNGAGKSTLLKLIAGIYPPTKGDISLRIDGIEIVEADRKFLMGWVAPYLKLYDGLTLAENIRFLAQLRGLAFNENEMRLLLEKGGLWEKRNQRLEGFSSGMKQRAVIFSALVHNPPILLLDEPTSNLDEAGKDFVETIKEEALVAGKLVIWATNEATELAKCSMQISV